MAAGCTGLKPLQPKIAIQTLSLATASLFVVALLCVGYRTDGHSQRFSNASGGGASDNGHDLGVATFHEVRSIVNDATTLEI
jgi:hypothetical protein